MRKGKGGSMLSAPQQQIILTVQDDNLPSLVILHGSKEYFVRKQESGHVTRSEIYHSDDVLPAFLTTGIDPSHLFRMTSHRPLSF